MKEYDIDILLNPKIHIPFEDEYMARDRLFFVSLYSEIKKHYPKLDVKMNVFNKNHVINYTSGKLVEEKLGGLYRSAKIVISKNNKKLIKVDVEAIMYMGCNGCWRYEFDEWLKKFMEKLKKEIEPITYET